MQAFLLLAHVFIAAAMIGIILLQKSEGGALGMGGGGGFMAGRGQANFLTRMTAGLALAFFITSLLLTILAAQSGGGGGSLLDRLQTGGTSTTAPAKPAPTAPANGSTTAPATTAPATGGTAPAPDSGGLLDRLQNQPAGQ